MDEYVKDESITNEKLNLISSNIDDTQPVNYSPDVPDIEEQK